MKSNEAQNIIENIFDRKCRNFFPLFSQYSCWFLTIGCLMCFYVEQRIHWYRVYREKKRKTFRFIVQWFCNFIHCLICHQTHTQINFNPKWSNQITIDFKYLEIYSISFIHFIQFTPDLVQCPFQTKKKKENGI